MKSGKFRREIKRKFALDKLIGKNKIRWIKFENLLRVFYIVSLSRSCLETWAEEKNLVYNTGRNKKNIDTLSREYWMRYLSTIKIYLARKEKPERRETHGFAEKNIKVSVKRKQFVEFLLWSSVTRGEDCRKIIHRYFFSRGRRNKFNCVINICEQVNEDNFLVELNKKRAQKSKEAKVIRRGKIKYPRSERKYQRKWKKSHKLKVRNIGFCACTVWENIIQAKKYLHIYDKRIRRNLLLMQKGHLFTFLFSLKALYYMNTA